MKGIARDIDDKGHGPQFVKSFVKSQKNDRNDAEAACEVCTGRGALPQRHDALMKVREAVYAGDSLV